MAYKWGVTNHLQVLAWSSNEGWNMPWLCWKKVLDFSNFFWGWNAERLCDWWAYHYQPQLQTAWFQRTCPSGPLGLLNRWCFFLLPCRSVRYLDVLGKGTQNAPKWRCFVRFWLGFFVSYNEPLFFFPHVCFFFPLCFLGRPEMNGWLDFNICQKFRKRTGTIFFHEWV